MINLRLPWPPSVNDYWGYARGRVYVKAKGKEYKNVVFRTVFRQRLDLHMKDKLVVYVDAHPPSNRRYDLDNLMKCVLDAITDAGVWEDDSQIYELHIYKQEVVKDGFIDVNCCLL